MGLISAADGYEGVTHAGLAVVAGDTARVLLTQRAFDASDDPEVQESWEIPGGALNEGEDPQAAAFREFTEETGWPVPDGQARVVDGWRGGPEGNYQGFVLLTPEQTDLTGFTPNDEVQAVGWFSQEEAGALKLRPEFAKGPWPTVSGNQAEDGEEMSDDTEPDLTLLDLMDAPVPVHGILAPEDVESGDSRGFASGAVTSRPYRLPFLWQKEQNSGHDKSFVVGSVDRLMRKDGMIHWEGSLMPTAEAGEFAELLAFFGRFGVSVDGDRGSMDAARSKADGVLWFDAVRASGLTAVAIPAFAEAYVAFGPHPDMPESDSEEFAVLAASGSAVSFADTFDRGPGWVTHPTETRRVHAYWTQPGQPGYAKIRWGTPGDFTRAKRLIGEKIAANSPEDIRYLNQIIAQWHHDALGYWPGEANKPGNPTTEEIRNRYKSAARTIDDAVEAHEGLTTSEDGEWETVLTSSAGVVLPSLEYFHRQENAGALVITEPDEHGVRRTFGYAAQWGVCHVGMSGRCVEPPATGSDDYPRFHLGRTRVATEDGDGYINTGVLTYKVGHRDAKQILSESAEAAHFDDISNAWAAVRVGEDEIGIWFSGVVLPGVPEDDIVLIEASGQVSGEWLRGEMRACLTVNVPGYAIERPSAEYDEHGNVLALAASAFGLADGEVSPCEPTPAERLQALREVDAEARFAALKKQWEG